MTADWQQFLEEAGFTFSGTGEPGVETAGAFDPEVQLVDASALVVVEVSGEDAFEFLQAQTCNDLSQVTATQGQLNGYCNPKGRLLALFTVLKVDSGFLLIVPKVIVDGFIKRLSLFILRAKVCLRVREDLHLAGILLAAELVGSKEFSNGSIQWPAATFSVADESLLANREHLRVRYPSHPDSSILRWLLIGSVESIGVDWRSITQAAAADNFGIATYDAWRAADILSARASVVSSTIESFIPQMVNLQLIDGLSFKKGCYPGQEIVARMQYLGKLKRHMRWFSVKLAVAPEAGTRLENTEDTDAGIVVDAVKRNSQVGLGVFNRSADQSDVVDVLAVVKIDKALDAFTIDGAPLTAEPMPYELALPL